MLNKIFRGFCLFGICVFASACATTSIDVEENYGYNVDNYISTEESRYADYNIVLRDDGSVFTTPEEKAFRSYGFIDKNLRSQDLDIIAVYYKDYLHKSRKTIERFMYRALPYLAYTRDVFRSRGLPEELAFLAFIESGYNPWAVSRSNAVGMWQFMAPTGRHCGLVQDWWMDERRNPYKATHAAADYLTELYNTFHDWHLAIAAYNAGPGKIGRALEATGATNFFELILYNHKLSGKLKLKEETVQYVPRYLAMTKIMRNFAMLGFEPEEHTLSDKKPVITMPAVEIMAKPGTDLASIAKELGMDWTLFSAYNPAYRRYITPPDRSTPFYVPYIYHEKAIIASKANRNIGWSHYKVERGDTLSKISKKVGVPLSVLRQLNAQSEPLQVGALLRIPGHAGGINSYVAESSNMRMDDKTYRVKRGDTFGVIAKNHGLSLKELQAANPDITDIRKLSPGQEILIPSSNSVESTKTQDRNTPRVTLDTPSDIQKRTELERQHAQERALVAERAKAHENAQQNKRDPHTSQNSVAEKTPEFHTVKRGDTFYSLARQYNMSTKALQALNPNANPASLKLGDVLRLSEKSTFSVYTVQRGDTFSKIAREHNLSLAQLRDANKDLRSVSSLSLGQKIRIPNAAGSQTTQRTRQTTQESQNPPPQSTHTSQTPQKPKIQADPVAMSIYIVKQGDSFHGIARRHGLTQEELALANSQIISRSQISIGQTINIPNKAFLEEHTRKIISYTVKKGDTFWNISQAHGMKTDELLELNKLNKNNVLSIGMKLKVYAK